MSLDGRGGKKTPLYNESKDVNSSLLPSRPPDPSTSATAFIA